MVVNLNLMPVVLIRSIALERTLTAGTGIEITLDQAVILYTETHIWCTVSFSNYLESDLGVIKCGVKRQR